ncbi:UNVERIFIED_CONTAM: hypothetical protein PYX00_007438 [Menopon gallinae]|uniref:SGTA homodimerisation domain-containing protein n=1 Tax=Menopon gallinae TaxID=328185 RepID=A0AAW2HJ67_9NEOP
MSDSKKIAYSIIKFLKEELTTLSPEACESIEVAIQCLESAYQIQYDDPTLDTGTPLAKIFASQGSNATANEVRQPTAAEKEQAESLKTEGNNLMKAENFQEALSCYTKAIQLDPHNPVYYCNRAAAHSRLNNHQATIEDCKAALKIEPTYSKAYGRLGLAYSSLGMFKEAKASYEKALELEPGNQTYVNNLELNEENLKKSMNRGNRVPDLEGFNMGALLENPSLIHSLASQFLSDPNLENMLSSVVSGSNNENGGIENLMRAGQRLMQQMQTSHPELIDQIRQQINNAGANTDPSKAKKD